MHNHYYRLHDMCHTNFYQHFPSPTTYLVRDPNNSLVEGDVVRISSGHRTSKAIHHVVTSIVAPFGEPVENRPPVLSETQLQELRIKERLLKDVRSAERGRQTSVQRLALAKRQGLTIPSMAEALQGTKAFEEAERERIEASGGKRGQGKTTKERSVEKGKQKQAVVQAGKKAKEAKRQTV